MNILYIHRYTYIFIYIYIYIFYIYLYIFYIYIDSFIHAISTAPLQVHHSSEVIKTQHKHLSEFHAKAPQATASEGLAQGSYVAARAGFEPTTLRTKGDESTNEPPWPR